MGLCLFFLPNFTGATFIQGGTFIPDSRVKSSVYRLVRITNSNLKLQNHTYIIVMYLLVVQIVRHMSICVLWQL